MRLTVRTIITRHRMPSISFPNFQLNHDVDHLTPFCPDGHADTTLIKTGKINEVGFSPIVTDYTKPPWFDVDRASGRIAL